MKKLEKITLFFLLLISVSVIKAQEVIPASGGNASGSGGTVSYSAGQVVYTTNPGTTGSAAQGVQQPFEISVITGIDNPMKIQLSCKAYPNPATFYLMLEVDNADNENLLFQLWDINGKLLESKKIESNQTIVSIGQLITATYFLKVLQTSQNSLPKEIKTFKIVKIN